MARRVLHVRGAWGAVLAFPLALAFASACALTFVPACRAPTEITLTITSNTCATLSETAIAIAPGAVAPTTAFVATQAGCKDATNVGSLVLVPSAAGDDVVAIEVIGGLGKDPATCTQGDPLCIVARRSLHYVPHTPLDLPIALESACAGVACNDPSTTCASGVCVPATVSCAAGTCELDGGTPDAGASDVTLDVGAPDVRADAGMGTPTVVASGQSSPVGVYVDTTDVYWTSFDSVQGAVLKCPLQGCTQPTVVASNQPGAFEITGDANNVYWTDFSGISAQVAQAPKSGGATVALGTGLTLPFGIAVSGTHVYWTSNDSPAGFVATCAIGGCNNAPTTLAPGQDGAGGVATDGANLYWTNLYGGQVMTCTLPACSNPIPLATGQGYPSLVALDAANVYWTNYTAGTIVSCSKTGCVAPTTIASGQNSARGIAVDATNVYWTTVSAGTVMKCAKSGCVTPTTLAAGQDTPFAVAVDATSVYWTTRGSGTVLKLTPK